MNDELAAVAFAFDGRPELNKPQPVVLFEVVKGMLTGKQPDLPDVKEIRK